MGRIRFIAAVAALGLAGSVPGWAAPVSAAAPGLAARAEPPPDVTATSWILYDDTFGVEIGSHNADIRRPMASTTKIMTGLVVLERARLTDRVTISVGATEAGESEVGLEPGEVWTVRQLLVALLVESANDAAVALAEFVGGSVEGFADLMNDTAERLELRNTRYTNPHGLDETGQYTSARDLLELSRVAMEEPVFAELVATRVAGLPATPEGDARRARTTNQLLGAFPGAIGIKTGYTDLAKLVFAAAAERSGRRLYAVVMGSDSHFAEAAALLEYGFFEYGLVRLVDAGTTYLERRVGDQVLPYAAGAAFDAYLSRDEAEGVHLTPDFDGEEPVLVVGLPERELARLELDGQVSPGLPTLRDAFAWASRYWDWLWGNA